MYYQCFNSKYSLRTSTHYFCIANVRCKNCKIIFLRKTSIAKEFECLEKISWNSLFFFYSHKIIYHLCVISDWFKGVRAAICLAFICNVAALVVVALRTFTSFVSPKILWIVGLVALGLSGKLAFHAFTPPPRENPGSATVWVYQVNLSSRISRSEVLPTTPQKH